MCALGPFGWHRSHTPWRGPLPSPSRKNGNTTSSFLPILPSWEQPWPLCGCGESVRGPSGPASPQQSRGLSGKTAVGRREADGQQEPVVLRKGRCARAPPVLPGPPLPCTPGDTGASVWPLAFALCPQPLSPAAYKGGGRSHLSRSRSLPLGVSVSRWPGAPGPSASSVPGPWRDSPSGQVRARNVEENSARRLGGSASWRRVPGAEPGSLTSAENPLSTRAVRASRCSRLLLWALHPRLRWWSISQLLRERNTRNKASPRGHGCTNLRVWCSRDPRRDRRGLQVPKSGGASLLTVSGTVQSQHKCRPENNV